MPAASLGGMPIHCWRITRRALSALVMLAALVAPAGCGGPTMLMSTPNLYINGGVGAPFADVPPELQSNRVEVLYLTDRAPEEGSTPEAPKYTHKRSRSVAFGVCEVRFGKDVSWDQLVEASTSSKRSVELDVAVTKTTELTRFPPTPRTLIELPPKYGIVPPEPDAAVEPAGATATTATTIQHPPIGQEVEASLAVCRETLRTRLARTPVKEVYLYVHGVKNDFYGSVMTIAQLWHFLGRQGVAIAYSWPSGGEGLLRGYNYDYNSSEFTVYHLKQTLRALAAMPEIEKIHIISHSRGTDTTVSALRELHLEISGGGRSTRNVLKLGTVVLAASDLDVDVVFQRAATARLGLVPERTVIYICENDEALALSRFLFGSTRLGKLKPEVFTTEELEALRKSRNLAFIDARVEKPGSFGHSYFYSNPAVSSDLILLMRYQLPAGAEYGRPLQASPNGFWFIDDTYPGAARPAMARVDKGSPLLPTTLPATAP